MRADGANAGSVMLETVIAIPLFMVLIGGTMWIGDLILAKQRLVIADRYAAWNVGNRHRTTPDLEQEIQKKFFSGVVDFQDVHPMTVAGGSVQRWWHFAWANVPMTVSMPVWTRGWLSASVVWDETIPEEQHQLYGRDIAETEHHVVVMRSSTGEDSNYPRNWDANSLGGDESRPWQAYVEIESWPDWPSTAPPVSYPSSPPNPPDHERHDEYVNWSI